MSLRTIIKLLAIGILVYVIVLFAILAGVAAFG